MEEANKSNTRDIEIGGINNENKSNLQNKKISIDFSCIILLLLILTIIVSFVSFIIFGIIFLIDDFNIAEECLGSNLWTYVLVTLILTVGFICNISSENDCQKKLNLICLALINLGLSIWGGIEIFENSCMDLKNSNLWIFSIYCFSLQVLISSFIFIINPLVVIISDYNHSKKYYLENEIKSNKI